MILRVLVMVAAVAAFVAAIPMAWVEASYTRGIYAMLQPLVTSASNRVPFALIDVLGVVVLIFLAGGFVHTFQEVKRRRSAKPAAWFGFNLLVVASGIYLAFLGIWGLNYRRQPLDHRLSFDPGAVRPEAAARLAFEVVRQLNNAYEPGHRSGFPGWPELPIAMRGAFDALQARLAPGTTFVPGMPKRSLLNPFFERAGVSGMTDPFFLEIVVDRSLLPFERPFVAAHEWAHLAGYANEGEANFVGWLTCVNGPPFAAYSGWLYLYAHALTGVPPAQRGQVLRALKAGPRADLDAIAERARRIEPRLAAFSWRVYDRYLKANRVGRGVDSYDSVLLLVLGTRFTNGWLPVMRPAETADPLQTPFPR